MSETAKFLTPEQAARVDHSRFDAEKIDRPTITYWQGAWRRLKKNPLAVIAMVMLAVVLFFVLLGPTISGQEYIKINASIKNTAPNSANWFGTDTMGRDIFCRVWIGARPVPHRGTGLLHHPDRGGLRLWRCHGLLWRHRGQRDDACY